ncbi:hypothetical protein GSI_02348 [Ganoderma sinense ZZ0214-1]|uniref:F-box domain-containing protein n=1 Tax=Ganoderma sinense ZZ0214-1 TaxID=1077348 RepID=A0A2G8SPE2_9APHY|nr:hypothetical protein GSI_02348 [Ganoderma sinense ZZ0214-1]
MTLIPGLFNIASRFLGPSIRKDCLDRLPNDVLVDVVFTYLSVFDIIRMRRVSRLYYELTHHAAVWKRLLRCTSVPLPPAPLTPKRPLSKISGLEAERLVTRAYSLDSNWRRHNPKALREWSFDAQRRIIAMSLLPGGDYLVASTANRADDRHNLVVFSMNTPGAPTALAALETTTKAYAIQAKYMTIKKERTIVIAYIHREYRSHKDRRKAAQGQIPDVSQYSTQHDITEVSFKYRCVVVHLPLRNLEALASIPYPSDSREFRYVAAALPKPFMNLFSLSSRRPLTSPVLAEMQDGAYLALVRGNNDIVFKCLEGGSAATLTCMEQPVVAQRSQVIKAIQLLPQEHAIFVVREIGPRADDPRACPAYAFETYLALRCQNTTTEKLRAAEQCIIAWELGSLSHIYLPEFPAFSCPDDLIADEPRSPLTPRHPARQLASPPSCSSSSPSRRRVSPPPPICMLARCEPRAPRDEALVRMLFLAQLFEVELPPTPPFAGMARYDREGNLIRRTAHMYRTTLERNQTWVRPAHDPNTGLRIVPAVTRPLMYTIPWDDTTDAPRVLDVRPVIDRGWEEEPRLEDGVVRHAERWAGCPAFEGGPCGLGAKVTAFAWDETIGRLMVGEEGSSEIMVYDFAAEPRQDFEKKRCPIPLYDIPNPDVTMDPYEPPVVVV